MKGFLKGFVYAGRGIAYAVHERNFRFHLCAAAFVTYFAAAFYQLSRAEWAVLLLTFALVLSLEAVNTSIERLCDKVCPERDALIACCKDIAAAAVLVSAVFSVGVGIVLLWDVERFKLRWEYFSAQPQRAAVLVAALTAAFAFVFLPKRKRGRSEDRGV